MRTVNIHEAKTHLSRLVAAAARGESFIIAKSGKPLVKVTPVETASRRSKFGFMRGQMKVPENFDRFAQEEIEEFFGMKP